MPRQAQFCQDKQNLWVLRWLQKCGMKNSFDFVISIVYTLLQRLHLLWWHQYFNLSCQISHSTYLRISCLFRNVYSISSTYFSYDLPVQQGDKRHKNKIFFILKGTTLHSILLKFTWLYQYSSFSKHQCSVKPTAVLETNSFVSAVNALQPIPFFSPGHL